MMAKRKTAKRVALYLRVRTSEQTVSNQRRELKAVAERHGWEVVAEFADEGISGAKARDKRPGFDRLMKAVIPSHVQSDTQISLQAKCKRLCCWPFNNRWEF